MDYQQLPPKYRVDIVIGIVLSVVTCGIYNVIWNIKQMEALNLLLGRREYKVGLWLVLSLLTCGLFHIYYEYKMGTDLAAILRAQGHPNDNLPLIGLVLSCVGLMVLADAIYQQEFNRMVG